MVEEQIQRQRELAAQAAAKKHWDEDEDEENEVDDTDDVDPEAEYAAWKLRRAQAYTPGTRGDRGQGEGARGDRASAKPHGGGAPCRGRGAHRQAKRKKEKGEEKMSYMQKYFHKGAFYQDESKAEGLDKRDIMGTRFADDVRNRELLPKALQMRDMTKLGKKGATRYKDLKSEDTGRWGGIDDGRPGGIRSKCR